MRKVGKFIEKLEIHGTSSKGKRSYRLEHLTNCKRQEIRLKATPSGYSIGQIKRMKWLEDQKIVS
ncbi:hypothetical protein [Marinoscillum furvescens]|uniref:hypothetical protein n=1 Tax=Marinoscillum furvescens TaxID=1026 RepID=UPI001C87C5A4|nr:hypothetical protein [Marinoscillum furvescens]